MPRQLEELIGNPDNLDLNEPASDEAVDNLIRRALRVSDPNDPETLHDRYANQEIGYLLDEGEQQTSVILQTPASDLQTRRETELGVYWASDFDLIA